MFPGRPHMPKCLALQKYLLEVAFANETELSYQFSRISLAGTFKFEEVSRDLVLKTFVAKPPTVHIVCCYVN